MLMTDYEATRLRFSRQIGESIDAVDIIKSDCDRCEAELKVDSSDQFFRRALVRNVCAYIEAFIYVLSRGVMHIQAASQEDRLIARTIKRTFDCSISEKDLRNLADDGGSRKGFKERFKDFTRIFAQVFCFAGEINYRDDRGWEAVWKTFELRDRLVHPKCGEELEIKEVELNKARAALEWAHRIMAERVAHAAKAIDEM